MSTTENIYLEELGIYFTYDPIGPFYSKAIMNKMDRFHSTLQKGRNIKLKELEKACRSYPHVPQFKNYLASSFQKNQQWDKLEPLLKQIAEKHPDYLFGKINQVEYWLKQEKYDKIPELLGENISSLNPNQKVFHETEVSSYYAISYKYFQAIGNDEQKKFCLDILEEVNPDHPLLYQNTLERMQENLRRLKIERSEKRRVDDLGYDISVQTDEKPEFIHQEIWNLYKYGTDISLDLLQIILVLPRESLIQDLENVLEDSIKRYEYFRSRIDEYSYAQQMFNEHALYLLIEIQAKESLEKIFRLLRQGSEFLNFWFGDALDEVFNEVFFKIEKEDLNLYKSFLLEPNHFTYARTIMSTIVREVYYQYPDRKEEVLTWFRDVYEYFLENHEDDSLIDSDLIGLMVWSNTDMNLIELEPSLKKLWDNGWIPPSMIGNWEDISESLHKEDKEDREYRERIKFFTLEERYEYIEKTWLNSTNTNSPLFPGSKLKGSYSNFRDNFPKAKKTPKVGRNAPCPCGSGKKYKKCCLGQ